ncbi:MAG: hypothetical protein WCG03_04835 [Kiritimatiellales bacterium]
MKIRVQFTPVLSVALLCASGWFSLWLFTFRPTPHRATISDVHTEVIRLVTDNETLRKLKTPTLFALPANAGFSGRFVENQVNLRLTLEKPAAPVRYLPKENSVSPDVNRALLTEETGLPQGALPAPGTVPRLAIRPAAGTQLFLSPKLKLRVSDLPQLHIAASGLPETVRANLAVRADGTVESAFFDAPITNTALLNAVRQLQFNPSKEKTEGWLDIRFAPEGKE